MAMFVPSVAAVSNPTAFYTTYEYHRTDTKVLMPDPRIPTNPLESTQQLLDLVRQGDHDALERLYARCVPPLRRWARGRLPAAARGALDTQDLVQDTVVNSLRRLEQFESRHEGALQAYLRQAVLNRIRDEARRFSRRPAPTELRSHCSLTPRRRSTSQSDVKGWHGTRPPCSVCVPPIARPSSDGSSFSTTIRS